MVMRRDVLGAVLLCGGLLATGLSQNAVAATSATSDILSPGRISEPADAVDLGGVRPIAKPGREANKPLASGNPLWAVPLSALSVTRERPIFSVSRRPPQPAVVAPPVAQAGAPAPQKPAEPERPPLALIGAVVGDSDAIAVFLDRTNQKMVRLRQGETHAGWLLSSVLGREVTLTKADRTEVLGLQRSDGAVGAAGAAGPGLPPPAPVPVVAGTGNQSFAPFIPRSTPKNGESDGL
jgi:general secretion pathway protein N